MEKNKRNTGKCPKIEPMLLYKLDFIFLLCYNRDERKIKQLKKENIC